LEEVEILSEEKDQDLVPEEMESQAFDEEASKTCGHNQIYSNGRCKDCPMYMTTSFSKTKCIYLSCGHNQVISKDGAFCVPCA
jgi:hypothetical protein